jgi:hypothetical protein
VSQANFRIAPLARPDLAERQPELLAHHLTAAELPFQYADWGVGAGLGR